MFLGRLLKSHLPVPQIPLGLSMQQGNIHDLAKGNCTLSGIRKCYTVNRNSAFFAKTLPNIANVCHCDSVVVAELVAFPLASADC
jgi:hypothetical protein